MKKSFMILTTVISLLGFTTQSFACLGSSYSRTYAPQYDIPSTYDLAIGKLPLHSNVYYNFIIQNNLEKIKNNTMTLDDYDDLAVAYNKIGDKAKAIELLVPLVKENPTRFSSISNLGSIYLNIGDFENGLKYLRLANTLKPVDNYDREYAQEKVYSYLKERNKKIPYSFPIQDIESGKNFADFALKNIPEDKQNEEIIRLIFGIENMVRFGNHDSPVSMEILGDLFSRLKNENNIYELNDNARDFYISALLKSPLKNEESLKSILNNNNLYFSEYQMNQMKEDIQKVKESRATLEVKEQQIINENQDIEKKLNEDLISKSDKKNSIMHEKTRLNSILITKKNEEKVKNYLFYTNTIDLFAWIGLIISTLVAITLIWGRQKKIKKHEELNNIEFYRLNSSIRYMNKSLIGTLGMGVLTIILVNTIINDFNSISFAFSLSVLLLFVISVILSLVNIYLIGFKKYTTNSNSHLSLRNKMRKAVYIGLLSVIVIIGTNLTENYIYKEFGYKTSSGLSFFNKSPSLRSVN